LSGGEWACGEELERYCQPDRTEVATVCLGDPAQPQVLCQSKDCRVDEAEPEILILVVELEDARIALLRKIGDEKRSVRQTLVESRLSLGANALSQKVIHFGDDRCWNNETTDFRLYQLTRRRVPGVATVVIGVEDTGVEEDRH
jgi:hypothetical protein